MSPALRHEKPRPLPDLRHDAVHGDHDADHSPAPRDTNATGRLFVGATVPTDGLAVRRAARRINARPAQAVPVRPQRSLVWVWCSLPSAVRWSLPLRTR